MAEKRVAVALSGGVDSAVTALILMDSGHQVMGLTMRLWREPLGADSDETGKTPPVEVEPCSPVESARRVADALGIPLHVVDVEQPFRRQVVDAFTAEYAAARTPNPCLYCNRYIKFGLLLSEALRLGNECLATGHYARTRRLPEGQWQLLKGVDDRKDQSYVLYGLGQEQLSRALFPLGTWTKQETIALARHRDLPVPYDAESQDLCFVPDNDYRRFLRRYAPQVWTPGPIVDIDGRELGQHQGLVSYTIGQRSGIGIPASEALYVVRMDARANALVVGPKSALGCDRFVAGDVNWVSGTAPPTPVTAQVKIRYRARLARATVIPLTGERAQITLVEPLCDVTPGQGVVFYADDVVLGGGLIER